MIGSLRRAFVILPVAWIASGLLAASQPAIDAEGDVRLTPLMRAAAIGDLKEVNALLEKGANPNVQQSVHRTTAMMLASYHGHIEVVEALLAKSADGRMQDALGARAIDWAILGRRPAIVKLHTSRGVLEHPFLDLGSMPFAFMDMAGKK